MRLFTLITVALTCVLPAAGRAAAPEAESTAAQRMAAHRLEQLARRSLEGAAEPHPARIREARLLLEHALAMDPEPAGRWLLLAEAEQTAGRRDGLLEALQQYLKRKPDDDVAQLQLIELYSDRQQTAEALSTFYRRIAEGPRSRRFSAALRSRIAFKGALVELEQGDPDAYARLLALALELDPTNKAAAVESFRVLTSSPRTSVADQASALLTLFQADPADPAGHVTVAESLFTFGLYEQAGRWYRSAHELITAEGRRPPQPMLIDWALTQWGSGRLNEALQLIRAAQSGPATEGEAANAPDGAGNAEEAADAEGENPEASPAIDPFANATADTLMPHALMLAASDQQEKLDDVFPRLIASLRGARQAGEADTAALVSEAWARMLCGVGVDEAAGLIDKIQEATGEDEGIVRTLSGWLALHQGDMAKAERLLEARADADSRAALGLCRLLSRQLEAADEGEATALRRRMIRRLRGVRAESPADLFGLSAAAKLRRLGLEPEPIEGASTMAETMAQVPADLRNISGTADRFVRLTAEADPERFNLGQGSWMTIRLRNASRYPLSLGPSGTIPTRLLVMPSLRIGADKGEPVGPRVVDLHRRLRLQPNEAVTVASRVDAGPLGRRLALTPIPPVRMNLTLLLNPRLDNRGAFKPGPLGVVGYVRHLVRRGSPASPEAVQQYIAQLGGSDLAAAMRAAALLCRLADAWADSDEPALRDAADQALAALANRVNGMNRAQQVWVAACVPAKPRVEGRFDRLLQTLADSDRSVVVATIVATQAADPESPWLNVAMRRGDGDPARNLAEARRTWLRDAGEGQPDP